MDLHEIIRAWASPLIAAGSLILAITTGRGKAKKDEQARLEERISAVEKGQSDMRGQLARVELTVQHLPTREQFHKMELSFAEMAGDMKVLAGSVQRVEKLIEQKA